MGVFLLKCMEEILMDDTTQKLIDVLVASNGQFKDTLFFAMSTMIGLIILFLGANFFTMRSFKNEEIARVKSEIELSLQNNFINKMKNDLIDEIDNKINEKLLAHTQQIQNLKEEINELKTNIRTDKENMTEQIDLLKAEALELKGDILEEEHSYTLALLHYSDAGIIYRDSKLMDLTGILNKIDQNLGKRNNEENLGTRNSIGNHDRRIVQNFIMNLDERYSSIKNSIENKLNS